MVMRAILPLYNDWLKGWYLEETVSYSQVASRKTEILWINFEPEGRLGLELR